MKFSRRNFLRSFALAAGGLWVPGARAQQFGGFTIPYLGGGLDTVWNGLNAYWKLEEATGAIRVDSTGNGNHLIDTSAGIAQAAGLIGNGGTSAGSAQCLEIADNAFVGAGPGVSFSLSTWVKSSGTANAIIAGKWASADNVGGQAVMDWSIGLNGGNTLVLNLHGPGFFDPGIIYGGSLNNTWQHLCITFQAGTHVCKRYLNGSLAGTTTEIDDIQRGAGSFALFNFGQVHAAGIVGSMDETGLWNRALSAAEVAHLYNGGSGLAYPGSASGPTTAGKWALRVGLNGGAKPSAGTVAALDTFWNGLVSDGIDGKMILVNCLVPDSLIAALTPLLGSAWTNNGFVTGDLGSNGLKGDGTKYASTNLSPNAAFANDTSAGITLYNTFADTGTYIDFGSQNVLEEFSLYLDMGGTSFFPCWDEANGMIAAAPPITTGYISANRTAANASTLYAASSTHAHASFGSIATTGNTRTGLTQPMGCFAIIGPGGTVVGNKSLKRLSFAAVHLGLTSAESALFYARIQTMRTALGGGFV